MRSEPILAIVGATGLVGNEIVVLLEERKFRFSEVRLLASQDSAGEVYRLGDDEAVVQVLDESGFQDVDIAIFAIGSTLAEQFVPHALKAGAFVIETSPHFRMKPDVALVVAGVNEELLSATTRMIASPCASTVQLAIVLKHLHAAAGVTRVVMSTYQAVSEGGKYALEELWEQTRSIFNQKDMEIEHFPHQIAFNCIPQIDLVLESGSTREEVRVADETRKVLGLPNLKISTTAVRVPVFHGHAQSVNIELERDLSPERVVEIFSSVPGVTTYSSPAEYPMPLTVAGNDEVHIGRVRRDPSLAHGLDLWIVADNIRRGSALNTVMIAETLTRRLAKE